MRGSVKRGGEAFILEGCFQLRVVVGVVGPLWLWTSGRCCGVVTCLMVSVRCALAAQMVSVRLLPRVRYMLKMGCLGRGCIVGEYCLSGSSLVM